MEVLIERINSTYLGAIRNLTDWKERLGDGRNIGWQNMKCLVKLGRRNRWDGSEVFKDLPGWNEVCEEGRVVRNMSDWGWSLGDGWNS